MGGPCRRTGREPTLGLPWYEAAIYAEGRFASSCELFPAPHRWAPPAMRGSKSMGGPFKGERASLSCGEAKVAGWLTYQSRSNGTSGYFVMAAVSILPDTSHLLQRRDAGPRGPPGLALPRNAWSGSEISSGPKTPGATRSGDGVDRSTGAAGWPDGGLDRTKPPGEWMNAPPCPSPTPLHR